MACFFVNKKCEIVGRNHGIEIHHNQQISPLKNSIRSRKYNYKSSIRFFMVMRHYDAMAILLQVYQKGKETMY